jgi:ribonucleoside-diphosphate reductase beta chain
VFDTIIEDEKIEQRAKSVTQAYDDLIEIGYKKIMGQDINEYELKKKLWLALCTVNILEGLRFYVSFACSFGFGELKLLEGSAKIISFIARDESQHLAISQKIINNYREHEQDKVMLQVIKDTEQQVYDMYDSAVQEEKNWATYLLTKGSMIGLSEKLLHRFIEHMANRRMRTIGLEPKYDQKTNPLPWISHWLNSKSLQNAPQETEIESYVIGGIKQDVEKDTFSNFKL